MTRKYLTIPLALLLGPACFGQCNAHRRHLAKPWTWLNSNVCEADYDAWLDAHPPKPWLKSWHTYVKAGLIATTVAADCWTTSAGQPRYAETNFLLGPHPSNHRIALAGLGAFSSYEFGDWMSYRLSRKDSSTFWRQYGRWQVPAIAVPLHGYFAIHNNNLNNKPCVVHYPNGLTLDFCT